MDVLSSILGIILSFILWTLMFDLSRSIGPLVKYKVIGHSMSPTLNDGQTVFVNRYSYLFKKPKLNDIVAAKIDGKVYIKRITKAEDRKFFLSGDNENDSLDSRKIGMVLKKDIIGKVVIK